MTEEERIASINSNAVEYLEEWLQQLENNEVTEDDLLASLYGGMIAAYILGFDPAAMLKDAKAGADKLAGGLLDDINAKCPNKDENGNCSLHNLHCQYPDCIKKD